MSQENPMPEFYFNKAIRCPNCGSFDCRTKWNTKELKCNQCKYEEI